MTVRAGRARRTVAPGRRHALLVLPAVLAGLAIGWIDSRPGYDATGLTVMLLLLAGGTFGWLSGRYPLLWGVLVGGWIALIEVSATGHAEPLAGLVFAVLGAVAGVLVAHVAAPRGR